MIFNWKKRYNKTQIKLMFKEQKIMKFDQELVSFACAKIVDLCKVPSPSGFTKEAINLVFDEITTLGYVSKFSKKGSLLVELGGQGNPLILAAHVDTLGAMVRAVKSNGRIRLTKIGSYPENNIEGENCLVHTRSGKTFSGTIQLIHPSVHVYEDVGSMTRNDSNIEVILDEKSKSEKETLDLGVGVGDFVSFDSRSFLTESGFIKSRHLDDKASVGVLIALAKFLNENKVSLSRKTYLLFTTYEEVGHGGSSGIPEDAFEIISVDMGAVGDDLKTDEYKVSICAKDSGGPYDYDITSRLISVAKKENLNFAVDIYPRYGSDAEASLRAGYDLKHALLGPGIFASHGYERTHRDAIENTLKLLIGYVQE
jgi:putative aminopeptidase FrvX